jgi:hypothetical protein
MPSCDLIPLGSLSRFGRLPARDSATRGGDGSDALAGARRGIIIATSALDFALERVTLPKCRGRNLVAID